MKGLSLLKSFRSKLIISSICIVGIIFGFGFYMFLKIQSIQTIVDVGILTEDEVILLRDYIRDLAKGSFFFLGAMFVFVFGMLINLILTLTFSLQKILYGVGEIQKGRLSYRITLRSEDEFGIVTKFLNSATESVEQSQKDLMEAKAGVEQKVEERTQELKEEQAKLLASIQSLARGYMFIDTHNNILLLNSAMEKILGEKTKAYTVSYIAERFKASFPITQLIEECLEKKQMVELKDVSFEEKYLRILLAPVLISPNDENPVGVVILVEDITQVKQLERMKLDFVSMAAHELRTPLTSIIGHISILKEEGAKHFTTEETTFLDRTIVSTQQLLALINNILNTSKIERGVLLLNKRAIDWKKLLAQTVLGYKTQTAEKHIEMHLDLPKESLPNVYGDTLQLTEVLNNLIGNAITYTNENGKIVLKTWLEKGEVVTSVWDNGIGIPKEAQKQLFTKFYRVTSALDESSNSKGTGLGLFISKSIIDLHKGKIWVESKEGVGSTFYISLPVVKKL